MTPLIIWRTRGEDGGRRWPIGHDISGGTNRYPTYRKPCGVSLVMRGVATGGPCATILTV